MTRTGPARLWADEEGEALAERLAAVLAALPVLPDQPRGVLPGLLDAVLDGAVVRSRRALRGREGAEHPRMFIWGLLEARLQTRRRDGARRPGRRRLAASDRSGTVAVTADAARASACPRPRRRSARRRTISSPAPAPPRGRAVLPAPARRRARGAGALADPAGDVPCRARRRRCRCIRRRPGPRRWTSRPAARTGAAAAPLPAGRAAAAPAERDRDRDLAARPLRHLCPAHPAPARAGPAGAGHRRGGLRLAGACRPAPVPATARRRLAADAAALLRAALAAMLRGGLREALATGGRRAWSASPTGWPSTRRNAAPDAAGHRLSELTGAGSSPGQADVHAGRACRPDRAAADGSLAILDYKTGHAARRSRTSRPAWRRNCRWKPRWPGRGVRRRAAGRGRGADLLAPHRRLQSREETSPFKRQAAGNGCRRESRRRRAGGADRRLRRSGALLFVAAAARAWRHASRITRNWRGSPSGPRSGMTATRPGGGRRERAPHRHAQRSGAAQGGRSGGVSAFVGASAGSGKTKLLTDRLLRLMLAGADHPHPVPHLHPRRRCRDGDPAASHPGALGQPVRCRAGRRTARSSTSQRTAANRALRARAIVRRRARPARRDADRHDPRLLPVAAAPLPAGGGAVAAFPADRGRRRGRRPGAKRGRRCWPRSKPQDCTRRSRLLAGQVQVEQFGGLIAMLQKRAGAEVLRAAMRDGPDALAAGRSAGRWV